MQSSDDYYRRSTTIRRDHLPPAHRAGAPVRAVPDLRNAVYDDDDDDDDDDERDNSGLRALSATCGLELTTGG